MRACAEGRKVRDIRLAIVSHLLTMNSTLPNRISQVDGRRSRFIVRPTTTSLTYHSFNSEFPLLEQAQLHKHCPEPKSFGQYTTPC